METEHDDRRSDRLLEITVTSIALAAAVLWFWAYQDSRSFRHDVGQLRQRVNTQAADLAAATRFTHDLIIMQQATEPLDQMMQPLNDADAFVDHIRQLAEDAQLPAPTLDIQPTERLGSYHIIPITLHATGPSFAVMGYLHELEKLRPTVQFDRVEIVNTEGLAEHDPHADAPRVHAWLELRLCFASATPAPLAAGEDVR